MNEEVLNLWIESGLISYNESELVILRKFIKLMDKHSLWLYQFKTNQFSFTNDAQRLDFTFTEIEQHIVNMAQGIPFPWQEFE
ncbi:MAG: hypothetical protein KDD94_12665 [Calditrichaeota bacterium]|nr:hypothetical protein [Calditrichota bacterium]